MTFHVQNCFFSQSTYITFSEYYVIQEANNHLFASFFPTYTRVSLYLRPGYLFIILQNKKIIIHIKNNKFNNMSADDVSKYMDKLKISDSDFYRKGTRASKMGLPNSTTDKSQRATQDQVLDPRTRMILFRMLNKGVFDDIKGCISTGKEANVYRALIEEPEQQLAVKVYKTAILAFKDRERYVVGEHRFRFGYSKSNPRKMVKLWAEKETRNLKRIFKTDIPVPKPLHLNKHVLVMEFLGTSEGYPSPKLKDAIIDPQKYPQLYNQLLAYMRIMYQECRLVHSDLSEYNILYHEEKLWIIDVSQSVEHDHPMSLEFLRMDIKNVNDYFRKRGVEVFGERQIFMFITEKPKPDTEWPETVGYLTSVLDDLPHLEITDEMKSDDAVFREVYIPRNLNDVFDIEGDVEKVIDGQTDKLVYKDLLGVNIENYNSSDEFDSEDESGEDEESDEGEPENEDITDVWNEEWGKKHSKNVTERKFKDRDANKERKKLVKQDKKEKRSVKMKKKDKKRLVSASKNTLKKKS